MFRKRGDLIADQGKKKGTLTYRLARKKKVQGEEVTEKKPGKENRENAVPNGPGGARRAEELQKKTKSRRSHQKKSDRKKKQQKNFPPANLREKKGMVKSRKLDMREGDWGKRKVGQLPNETR